MFIPFEHVGLGARFASAHRSRMPVSLDRVFAILMMLAQVESGIPVNSAISWSFMLRGPVRDAYPRIWPRLAMEVVALRPEGGMI